MCVERATKIKQIRNESGDGYTMKLKGSCGNISHSEKCKECNREVDARFFSSLLKSGRRLLCKKKNTQKRIRKLVIKMVRLKCKLLHGINK